MWNFQVSQSFLKDLKKLDEKLQERIKAKLKQISVVENPLILAKKLKGYKNIYRFRVGNFRIIFSLDQNTITFEAVDHRKDIYN